MRRASIRIGLIAAVGAVVGLAAHLAVLSAQDKNAKAGDDYIRVEVRGRLQHGVVAIGGETTGTTITARGITWELDLKGKADLAKIAEKLDGRAVVVAGALDVKKGVEIRQRWIVTVTGLKAAE